MAGSHGNPLFNFEFQILECSVPAHRTYLQTLSSLPCPSQEKANFLFIYFFLS